MRHFFVFIAIAALFMSGAFEQAEGALILGGDFGGADLLPNNGDILSGTFTNVGQFIVNLGDTVLVDPGVALSVTANKIDIDGTLAGTGAGFAGGLAPTPVPNNNPGAPGGGPGGGAGGGFGPDVHGEGGGGGGYGGPGGQGGENTFGNNPPGPALGGPTYGDASSPSVDMGSGGGAAASHNCCDPAIGGDGGSGGSSISLFATDIFLDGAIIADGQNGFLGTIGSFSSSSGGGGAGGGILLDGAMTLNGLLSARGGSGAGFAGPSGGFATSGGGGGGGRIKLFGESFFDVGFSVDVSGGGFGATDPGFIKADATAGAVGTFFDDTVPITTVIPEPGTLTLLLISIFGLLGYGYSRKRRESTSV
jgi:hypothetical protein